MIRRSVAGVILGVSLLVGSFAWSGFLALRTVFDPDRSRDVAEELLDNDEVRAQLSENLAFAIGRIIPAEVPVSDEVIDGVTAQVLNDPAVEALILDAFAGTHAAFLGEGDAPEFIDLTAAAAAARASLVATSPQLDAVIPQSPNLTVPLPTERIPNAAPVRRFLEGAVPVLAIIAIVGAVLALFTTSDRPSILRRAGFWALTTTAVFLAIGLGVPWLLRLYAPDQAEVLAALMSALLRSTLVPSAALGLVCVGLLAASAIWPAAGAGRGQQTPQRARSVPAQNAPPQQRRPPARIAPQVPAQSAPPQQHRQPDRIAPPAPQPRVAPVQPAASPYPVSPPPPSVSVNQSQAPAPAASHSVFSDVAPPTTPEPGSGAARSVFPEPASERPSVSPPVAPTDPFAEFAPRWVEGHGWLLHPDDPRPIPADAVWVEGMGHVVRTSR